MNEHLHEEQIARVADGEDVSEAAVAHLRDCARCANGVSAAMRFKRAVRDATPSIAPPPLRMHQSVRLGWLAAAAVVAILVAIGTIAASRRAAGRELIDLHTTIVASTNPIDVLSTDRHTVKPWFEGKVPFAVDVPELTGTPFRLAGGRVVFWRGRPGAYLLVTKGAHRISVFVFSEDTPRIATPRSMTIETWERDGLRYIAVGDVPLSDLDQLKRAFM